MSFQALAKPPRSGANLQVQKLPKLPKKVIERFPELAEWEAEMEAWRQQLVIAMRGQAQ